MSRIPPETAALGLAVGRMAVGIGAFLAPETSSRVLGTNAVTHPPLTMMLRLFGGRDAAMAIGYLTADAAERGRWLTLGAAVDTADAAAALLAGAKSGLPRRTRYGIAATALTAAATAAWARSQIGAD